MTLCQWVIGYRRFESKQWLHLQEPIVLITYRPLDGVSTLPRKVGILLPVHPTSSPGISEWSLRRFRKNCERWILASSCLPIYPHETTLLPLERFAWTFIFTIFRNRLRNFKFHLKSDGNNGYFTRMPESVTSWDVKCFTQKL